MPQYTLNLQKQNKTNQAKKKKKKKKNIGNDIEKLEASYTAEFVK